LNALLNEFYRVTFRKKIYKGPRGTTSNSLQLYLSQKAKSFGCRFCHRASQYRLQTADIIDGIDIVPRRKKMALYVE
jgi:hypothetical protein